MTFDAPDKKTLLQATGIAAFIALVVLVLFVMPAEYGRDPTGFGDAIGIKSIAAPGEAPSIHSIEDTPFRNDTAEILVPAGTGLEYKFRMQEGSGLVYTWQATGDLFFDFHGEPTEGPSGYFESYEVDTRDRGDGSFNAPFEGTHGWYFRNEGTQDVTVTLTTSGHYEVVGLV